MSKVLLNIRTREAKVEAESSVRYHVCAWGSQKLGPTRGVGFSGPSCTDNQASSREIIDNAESAHQDGI
jgi:hypothetical protein